MYRYSIIVSDAAISSTDTLDKLRMRRDAALFVSSRQGMPSDASAALWVALADALEE